MAIMYPIYHIFNNMIFSESKPFEFRTKLPKNLKVGDKILIYEPVKYGGSGMVVGEFTVGDIIKCDYVFGACNFIVHFCKNVLNNEEYAQKFERALNAPKTNYKRGSQIKFALDDESMDYIYQNKTWPNPEEYVLDKMRLANIDEAEHVWRMCDKWLSEIGFYDSWGDSNYEYALAIANPIKYVTPKRIGEYTKINGQPIIKAPQSFVYVKT